MDDNHRYYGNGRLIVEIFFSTGQLFRYSDRIQVTSAAGNRFTRFSNKLFARVALDLRVCLHGPCRLYWLLMGFTGSVRVFTEFLRHLVGFAEFHKVVPGLPCCFSLNQVEFVMD